MLAACTPLAAERPRLLNEPLDISGDFQDYTNVYFLADSLDGFDPVKAEGKVKYKRNMRTTAQAFDNTLPAVKPSPGNEFPEIEYAADPSLPFSVEFVTPRTVRIRMASGPAKKEAESLMLAGPVPKDASWKYEHTAAGHRYTSTAGSVTISENPWRIELRDAAGHLLTQTEHAKDNETSFSKLLPFSFIRRGSDYSRSMRAVFSLSPGEKIFGCGESFTEFDKRGQKIVLWTTDANGVQTPSMYKPIPFFMSSAGYGMFLHTSAPVTCDFGHSFSEKNALMSGDDALDLFVFLGNPEEVLGEYTVLTGKSPVPPLWSFGLWMSRCTYLSEEQVRDVAGKMRSNKIPCDVLHLDTGWFETDWRCDYKFSKTRFPEPAKMITDLKNDGFHVSLWQLPYFVPKNDLFPEIVSKGLAVRDANGSLPAEDAVLDYSNPVTVEWIQEKIAALLKTGVGAIKVDFGEAAPLNGVYASGRSGFYEHNLYPLRYNKAIADVTRETTGENIIWARSTWAGSQRYPLHWGGDAEATDSGMAAELRGGLSFGLSGFSFWSHDAGGFVGKASEDLYLRWLAFSVFTSHSRCHGMAPKEPWNYSPEFMEKFRRIVGPRYRLMPYLWAQAHDSSARGIPMLRSLFFEFPGDPGSWKVDDEYLLGSSLLVAPLMHEGTKQRAVYLPPGRWTDYQTGSVYQGGWQEITAADLPVVLLVRDGSVIPHIGLAQSTSQMDWSKLELAVYGVDPAAAAGLVALPDSKEAVKISLVRDGASLKPVANALDSKVSWSIRTVGEP
ncbi:MAG: TIM-barrel domain-containing protein [Luteolibacter sp.]